ncbi:hypothetical protein P3T76_010268 [Phytophthora citrophthora]|uniref:Uncharacterized protein n=1 Tax=Phytophthora citrophthora TaxID=4793 RepID=A0AAD9LG67_9STRA|nr:hypothetical protein P3T76_010268 [Phytophthora citrophthora]
MEQVKTGGDELRVLDCFLSDMHRLDSDSLKEKVDTCTASEAPVPGNKREQVERMRAPKRKRKNPSWLKRKQELYTLRQQTEELGTHVAYLQHQHESRRHQLDISAERFAELSKYEFIEKKRQQAALTENAALKAQVRKFSHVLVKLRTDVATASERSQFPELAVSSSDMTKELQNNKSRLFTTLQARLDKRTNDVHILLREIRESLTCQDSYSVQMHDGWVEYSWSQVLPFHVLATFNAAWGIVETGGSRQNLVSRDFGRSQDVYTITSRHALASAAATVDSHSVIKRYIAPGKFIIIAESKSEHFGAFAPTCACESLFYEVTHSILLSIISNLLCVISTTVYLVSRANVIARVNVSACEITILQLLHNTASSYVKSGPIIYHSGIIQDINLPEPVNDCTCSQIIPTLRYPVRNITSTRRLQLKHTFCLMFAQSHDLNVCITLSQVFSGFENCIL